MKAKFNTFLLHCHTLGEILWLIDITTKFFCYPDGDRPKWDEREKWSEKWVYRRNFDDIIIEVFLMLFPFRHYSENNPITSLDFFDIRICLFSENSFEIQND